jgi:hypothetical protein
MNRPLHFFFFSSLYMLFITACAPENKDKTETSTMDADDILSTITELERKVNGAYYFLHDDEAMKIKNLELIIEQIEKSGQFDTEKLSEVKKKHKLLESKILKIKDLYDSDIIDQYDALYKEVSNEIIELAEQHPNYHQILDFEDLIILIQNLDARKLTNRVEYDAAAKEYNKYIKDNKEVVQKISKDKNEKYGLFSLGDQE